MSGIVQIKNPLRSCFDLTVRQWAAYQAFGVAPRDYRAIEKLCFFDGLGICYNRVQKNANTTVVCVLCALEGYKFKGHSEAKKKSRKVPARSVLSRPVYHKMVVVRSPYTRLLSAFLQKFTYRREKYVPVYGDFSPTPEGFRDFVMYLAQKGISGNSHWDLQKKQIAYDLSFYDTVVRFENFSTEFGAMLEELNLGSDDGWLRDLWPSDTKKKTQSSTMVDRFYDDSLIDIVRELYSEDFAFLGYNNRIT
ncbi:sulfotransferase family 2 domain-containing protein [Thioalkalivibrio sp. ALE11]|uniref:sulfotransferase family 2 domain-containing protein n=1 Tax=Thioalkalivibrio sp. ALE11 TaxID=1265494 RepID=UPI0009DA8F80|nr:sulfotransferase family 2 domain-containing protein [Thioalkalivibrio sp. ALE11]